MEKTIKNVTYTNIPGDLYGLGISDTIIQTNISASGNTDRGNYVTDSTNFYPLIHAIDIDWDGIREGDTVINDTSDLITWIKSLPSSGAAGADGKSAYQSYLDTTTDSPKKTEAQWVASLKGADGTNGTNGTNGVDGTSVTISSINQNNNAGGTSTVTFSDGKTLSIKNGINGSNGTNGTDGTNGVGIKSVSKTSGTGAAGTTDTYTVYDDNNTSIGTFTVYNGADGANGTGSGSGDVSGLNLNLVDSSTSVAIVLKDADTELSSVEIPGASGSTGGLMNKYTYSMLYPKGNIFNNAYSGEISYKGIDLSTVTLDVDGFSHFMLASRDISTVNLKFELYDHNVRFSTDYTILLPYTTTSVLVNPSGYVDGLSSDAYPVVYAVNQGTIGQLANGEGHNLLRISIKPAGLNSASGYNYVMEYYITKAESGTFVASQGSGGEETYD